MIDKKPFVRFELGDDDYADLYLRYEFQEYCDKEYNKR